ncbi:MAG: hypothetical protein AAGA03_19350 [Planctomycetota bacterium]
MLAAQRRQSFPTVIGHGQGIGDLTSLERPLKGNPIDSIVFDKQKRGRFAHNVTRDVRRWLEVLTDANALRMGRCGNCQPKLNANASSLQKIRQSATA